ncbi:Autophagy-related protein 22 [Talaromyces pinophilus]|nr:Autophagy-related protein 22 [Talaromyces pinophilus]
MSDDDTGIHAEPEKYASQTVSTAKDNNVIDVEEIGQKNSPNSSSINSRGQEEPEPVTTRMELWAWYFYYFGNNSAGTLSYAPLIFQYILSLASVDSEDHSLPCGDGACVVQFGSRWTNIDTVVLTSNGIVFAFQAFFLICFGSMADYGPVKRWVLIFWTIVCWATQFAFLGLQDASQYRAAIGVYIITYLSYNLCQAFWTPGLPLLARNTPESVRAKQEYISGDITEDEYQARVMLQRNKLSNYAFGAMSTGYTLTLIIALGAAFGLHANDSTHNNIRAAVVIVGIATGVWIVFGTPWFFIEKNRSNKLEVPLPAGSGKQSTFAEAKQYIVTGLKVYWNVLKHIPHLTQTWLYLVGFFLISDGFATTNQIYGIAQNTIVSYSTTTSTELYIVQGFSNLVGIAVFWLIQRHFRIRTKTILIVNCIFVILNAVWGCIGIGTTKFGLHNTWEVWAYSVFNCAFAAPFTAFTATMLSDLCPKGREVTFFSLYSLVSKSTAWIGPIISGVIIDRTGSTWKGFPFALGMSVVGFALICLVDVKKGQEECERYVKLDTTLKDE